ncbi:MAG: ChAPs family protein, partial [Clostridiales bacterium]|nr:ChAPs family protein [Clostridiales bacterium]
FGSNDSEPGTDLFTSGLGKELYNLGLTTTDYAALEYRQTLNRYSADLQRYIDANRDLKAQLAENEQDREELLAQIAELQKKQEELMAQIAAMREGKE